MKTITHENPSQRNRWGRALNFHSVIVCIPICFVLSNFCFKISKWTKGNCSALPVGIFEGNALLPVIGNWLISTSCLQWKGGFSNLRVFMMVEGRGGSSSVRRPAWQSRPLAFPVPRRLLWTRIECLAHFYVVSWWLFVFLLSLIGPLLQGSVTLERHFLTDKRESYTWLPISRHFNWHTLYWIIHGYSSFTSLHKESAFS